jgi:L-histidine N-alpha-methyltransferase
MNLTKRQEAELVTAIQGRGEVPLKFTYLGEGAGNWDKIATDRTEGGGINSAEGKLLNKRIDDFLSTIDTTSGVNLIDIGCGNGYPVYPIVEYLKSKNIKMTYVPMDISQEMLDLAVKNVSKDFGIECKSIQMDFELGQFSDVMYEVKQNGSVNLMLFLGSTLGNHSDLNRVLSNFRDSMTSKDYLILGVELTNLAKVSKIIPHYQSKDVEKFVTHTLRYLNVTNYDIDISWNEKNSQIEIRAQITKDTEVQIANEKFVLQKDESILLARSIKFTEYTATKILSDVGFRTELLTTNEDRGYLLTMIQPTRYSV